MYKTMLENRAEEKRLEKERKEDRERARREEERNRKKHWERLRQIIGGFREDVQKMTKSLSVKTCEERASKPAGDISKLENKSENSAVEVNN
jgi:F0F1-type ATP synthase membrane subunit b/b'